MATIRRGRCALCGYETTKGSIGKHSARCPQLHEQVIGAASGKPETLLRVRMQDGYEGTFWLDVEVRSGCTLGDVDAYLRAIWLECCGHMSKFSIGGWGGTDAAKSRRVQAVLTDGVELTHIYDFGTESVTRITAVGSRQAVPLSQRAITLMARNLPPEVTCVDCDRPASPPLPGMPARLGIARNALRAARKDTSARGVRRARGDRELPSDGNVRLEGI